MEELLNELIYLAVLTLTTTVIPFLIKLIRAKIAESTAIKEATNNEILSNLVKEASDRILDAVVLVNQTYSDSIKKSGEFTKKAQEEAFNKAYATALCTISDESRKAVEKMCGSYDNWVRQKIEVVVNQEKK